MARASLALQRLGNAEDQGIREGWVRLEVQTVTTGSPGCETGDEISVAELPRASDAVIEAVAGHPPGCRRCSRAGFGAQPNHVFFADPFHDIGIPVDHPYWLALDDAMDAIGRELRASPSLTQVDSWRLPEPYDWIGVAVFEVVEQAQPG